MKTCPSCGKKNQDEVITCSYCGKDLPAIFPMNPVNPLEKAKPASPVLKVWLVILSIVFLLITCVSLGMFGLSATATSHYLETGCTTSDDDCQYGSTFDQEDYTVWKIFGTSTTIVPIALGLICVVLSWKQSRKMRNISSLLLSLLTIIMILIIVFGAMINIDYFLGS